MQPSCRSHQRGCFQNPFRKTQRELLVDGCKLKLLRWKKGFRITNEEAVKHSWRAVTLGVQKVPACSGNDPNGSKLTHCTMDQNNQNRSKEPSLVPKRLLKDVKQKAVVYGSADRRFDETMSKSQGMLRPNWMRIPSWRPWNRTTAYRTSNQHFPTIFLLFLKKKSRRWPTYFAIFFSFCRIWKTSIRRLDLHHLFFRCHKFTQDWRAISIYLDQLQGEEMEDVPKLVKANPEIVRDERRQLCSLLWWPPCNPTMAGIDHITAHLVFPMPGSKERRWWSCLLWRRSGLIHSFPHLLGKLRFGTSGHDDLGELLRFFLKGNSSQTIRKTSQLFSHIFQQSDFQSQSFKTISKQSQSRSPQLYINQSHHFFNFLSKSEQVLQLFFPKKSRRTIKHRFFPRPRTAASCASVPTPCGTTRRWPSPPWRSDPDAFWSNGPLFEKWPNKMKKKMEKKEL